VWSSGISVQQELVSGVALNVGFFRNSWGNQSIVDNTLTALSDYTPFGIAAPIDPRLPGGGGQTISGLFDLNPNKVGQVLNLHELASVAGADMVNNWQGYDIGVNARMKNGLTVQGGTSTGRRLTDSCAVRALIPERTSSTAIVPAGGLLSSATNPWCRGAEPYRTSATGLATYLVPKIDLQASLTWQSNPGPEIAANYVANNAWIAQGPQPLGRNLSGGANVTVNLVQPGTLFGDRLNQLDLRFSKILKFGGRSTLDLNFDIYNALNSDAVLTEQAAYSGTNGGAWLLPTSVLQGRIIKFGARWDF
jgi:hypothetical protein